MKKPLKVILAVVIASLLFNLYSIVKMNQIGKELEYLRESYSRTEWQMMSEVSSIQQQLYEWRESEKWVSDIHFLPDVEASTLGNIHLDVQWTFKELESDADVVFSYKKDEEAEWREVVASLMSGTTYEAAIQIDPEFGYLYKIDSVGSLNRGTGTEYLPVDLFQSRGLTISYSTLTSGKTTHFEAIIEQRDVWFDFYKVEKAKAYVHLNDGSQKVVDFTYGIYDDGIYDDEMQHELDGEEVWAVQVEMENMVFIEVEVTYGDGSTEKDTFHLHEEVVEEIRELM
ncbi:hypothetical protein [Alkalihalobacterium chitinilyticum]|uniref:Uncharacterized protein n=1 Tax=Alkalihalobacterium chitinilyticum TaxID=2980103 RepID=A0ABT5VD12_9BACI|nr:hypothetical protein [Alkalihalobacterium chitinilyticum]MDE5413313.1 hypothetical protein [Alkalihalobacterium chitinilyticum]